MFTMITERHNYDNGYISLVNIELANAPNKITVDGTDLLKKNEFHISIMSVKHLAPMLNPDDTAQMSGLLKQNFIDFTASDDLTNFSLTGDYRLVRRDHRVTVVAMVNLQGLEALFDYLRQKHHYDLPTQPAHITLYTLQPDTGIGILSQQELENYSIPIEIPELANLAISK